MGCNSEGLRYQWMAIALLCDVIWLRSHWVSMPLEKNGEETAKEQRGDDKDKDAGDSEQPPQQGHKKERQGGYTSPAATGVKNMTLGVGRDGQQRLLLKVERSDGSIEDVPASEMRNKSWETCKIYAEFLERNIVFQN